VRPDFLQAVLSAGQLHFSHGARTMAIVRLILVAISAPPRQARAVAALPFKLRESYVSIDTKHGVFTGRPCP
jgi:hypothetical protein